MTRDTAQDLRKRAFSFVLTMGIVNLFADITYEGGGSLNGPFLGFLGAGAALISIVAGFGEFLGYAIRLPAGYIGDRTGKLWLLTFIGYLINLLAVPAMALAGNWQTAALFLILERAGRAIRKPTVESMLSYTTGTLGKGWVYGLNTALDETGATLGPLLMALVLWLKGPESYSTAYAWLLVPSLLAIACVGIARFEFPDPKSLDTSTPPESSAFSRAYWLSMAGGACLAAGLLSFEFVSFHLLKSHTVTPPWIPFLLSIATLFGIGASLGFGKAYDRHGIPVVLLAIVLSAAGPPLLFFGGFYGALGGMILWGLGYATQDTLLKAIVAGLLPRGRRNVAFGLFYTGYGSGWLIGSIVAGLLYDKSITAVVIFAVASQLAALPLLAMAARNPEAH
ncbi:MAG: MFS transporter [Verrucomicrobiota bacterium]